MNENIIFYGYMALDIIMLWNDSDNERGTRCRHYMGYSIRLLARNIL